MAGKRAGVGLSHKSAAVATLVRAAVSGDTLAKLLVDLAAMFGVGATIGALNGRSTVRMGLRQMFVGALAPR